MDAPRQINRLEFKVQLQIVDYLKSRLKEITSACPPLKQLAADASTHCGVTLTVANVRFVMESMGLEPSWARPSHADTDGLRAVLRDVVHEIESLHRRVHGLAAKPAWIGRAKTMLEDGPGGGAQGSLIDT